MGLSRVPRFSIIAFLFAAALLAVVGWLCVRQSRKAREANSILVHTLVVRENITHLLKLVDDAETGQRGFLITGDPSYLEPYRQAEHRLLGQTEELGRLIRGHSVQEAHLAELQGLIAAKMKELDDTIRVRQTQGFVAAARIVKSGKGRQLMERVRGVGSSMLKQEVQLYTQREDVSVRESRSATLFALLLLALAVPLVLGSGLLLARQYRLLERTEEDLQQSERRYRTLVEGVEDYAIFALDPDGRVTSWNAGAEKIMRYQANEILGQHFSRFHLPADVEGGKAERVLNLAALEGRFHEEGWRVRRGGSRFWAGVVITALRDPRGRLIGYSKITRDLTARKQAEDAIRASEHSLRQLSTQLLHAQDEERRRFARDLHDSAGQCLAVLKMRLDSLESSPSLGHGMREKLRECIQLAADSMREVRATSYELYPPMLEEAGLRSAIPWFLDGFKARSGITTTLEMPDDFDRAPRDVELAIFRVLQESLTNVRRHSGSSTAHVRVANRDGIVELEVSDQGKGIPPETLRAYNQGSLEKLGIGLRGMKERLHQLGGRLDLASNGWGTMVTATIPIAKASKAASG